MAVFRAPRSFLTGLAFIILFCVFCGFFCGHSNVVQPVARAMGSDPVRRPRGIYAVAVLDEAGAVKGGADLAALAGNPAVSGLAIRASWSTLQPAKDRYDWSKLDAAFAVADAKHKTIQLILLPGFHTPSWVLDELVSCDDLLGPASSDASAAAGRRGRGARRGGEPAAGRRGASSGSASTESSSAPCGKQTFEVSEGARHGLKQALPLPWNPTYKAYWKAFLTAVEARFGTNDAFVSIAVTGPTAESAEIIVPRTGDQLERWAQLLELSYRDSSYHRTDKAFIEEWEAAATMFGQVFRSVTIVLTRGSGLPSFSKGQGAEAQASIVSSFGRQAVGSNMKATQTSGLKACRDTEGGIKGVKEMTLDHSLSPPVLGGAQFDTSFSEKPATEGCAASCDADAPICRSVTPKDALGNVLAIYFEETPAGGAFHTTTGRATMNYLQIYAPDIVYAGTHPDVQALLDQASQRLLGQAR